MFYKKERLVSHSPRNFLMKTGLFLQATNKKYTGTPVRIMTTPIPSNFLIMGMLGGNMYLPVSFGFAIIGTMVMKIVAIIYIMGKIKLTYRKFFSQIISEIYKNVFRTLRGRFHSGCFHLNHGRHKTASPMEISKTLHHTKL